MAAPETAFIKAWCRIDGAEFDAILPALVAHVTELASHETGVDYSTVAMPEGVQMWCAAQVAHWLANPEASVTPTGNNPQRNMFLDGLLDPHRTYAMEAVVV
jgi:hypothetical protein